MQMPTTTKYHANDHLQMYQQIFRVEWMHEKKFHSLNIGIFQYDRKYGNANGLTFKKGTFQVNQQKDPKDNKNSPSELPNVWEFLFKFLFGE